MKTYHSENATARRLWSKLLLVTSSAVPLLFAGCRVGPNYHRPNYPAPPEYRGADTAVNVPAGTKSFGDEKWWTVFGDPALQELLRKGVAQNFDVRVAAERVVQSQAQLSVTRSAQFPQLSGTGGYTSQRYPQGEIGTDPLLVNLGSLGLSAAWNLDFWGQYRRATEAARAEVLSTEWARRAVLSTVVMNIASSYFTLRALDQQLEIAKQSVDARKKSVELTKALELAGYGSTTLLDVREAEQSLFTAEEQIPDIERQIENQEDSICTLIGENPHPITRGIPIDKQLHMPEVPAGVPSELLERRPDIRESEADLIAANAEIGVARAQYFPQISLTGTAATESSALTKLFSGPAAAWSYGPTATIPIFTAGRIRGQVRSAESQQRQSVLAYQKTIASAFRDVSVSLVAYRKYQEALSKQEQLAAAAQNATYLSNERFKAGQTTYLEVLTNDTNYFSAELQLATARQNQMLALVQLYNALGGGWRA